MLIFLKKIAEGKSYNYFFTLKPLNVSVTRLPRLYFDSMSLLLL